jgi:hypothetical protein
VGSGGRPPAGLGGVDELEHHRECGGPAACLGVICGNSIDGQRSRFVVSFNVVHEHAHGPDSARRGPVRVRTDSKVRAELTTAVSRPLKVCG